MSLKYKTNIEITSEATNRDEAMEIVGDYLSGNIVSGIEMKCTSKPVRFYNHTISKVAVVTLLVAIGFLSGAKSNQENGLGLAACQTAAVQPPLKTSDRSKDDLTFRREWEDKQAREALSFIKK